MRNNRHRPVAGRPGLLGIALGLAVAWTASAAADLGAYTCAADTEYSCSAEGCERLDGPPNDLDIDLDAGAMFLCLYTFCDAAPVEVLALGGGMYTAQATLDLPEDSGGGRMPVIVSIDTDGLRYTLLRGAGGEVAHTVVGRCTRAE